MSESNRVHINFAVGTALSLLERAEKYPNQTSSGSVALAGATILAAVINNTGLQGVAYGDMLLGTPTAAEAKGVILDETPEVPEQTELFIDTDL